MIIYVVAAVLVLVGIAGTAVIRKTVYDHRVATRHHDQQQIDDALGAAGAWLDSVLAHPDEQTWAGLGAWAQAGGFRGGFGDDCRRQGC